MQDKKLKKEFFTSLKNYEFKLTEQSAYEIALWIESNEKHLCASQQNNFTKYNLGEILLVDPEFEVGTPNDGFQRNTVVMLYEAKYIDKNRVISKLGKTSNQFFDKIYNKLFEQIFEPIHYKMEKLKNNH